MPQAVLGVAFSFGIPMAFAAVQADVPPVAWTLLAGNLLWVLAYDTEYAMVDRDDDLKIGIHTSAITLGRWDVAAVMGFYGAFLAIPANSAKPIQWFSRKARKQPSRLRSRISVQCHSAWAPAAVRPSAKAWPSPSCRPVSPQIARNAP